MPPKTRRRFTASEKLRLVKAAEAAVQGGKRGALEALLRKEGIYSSHLSAWRQQLAVRGQDGLAPQKPGRKPKLDAKDRELLAAKKELASLKRKLHIANAVIDLQKKSARRAGPGAPRTPRLRRGELMAIVEQRDDTIAVTTACEALDVSRAGLYRHRLPPREQVKRVRAPSPRRLDDGERQHILDTLHLPEFADQPPSV